MTSKNVAVCTTRNGAQILCTYSEIGEHWCFESKGGKRKLGSKTLSGSRKISSLKSAFTEPRIFSYELDPFEESSFTELQKPVIKPYLTCLHYVETSTTMQTNQVPKSFFKEIFGRNATLISKEVLLAGFPDGRTIFMSITGDNAILSPTLIANLEQAIIYIQRIKEGLLIVGHEGKLCICLNYDSKQIFYIPAPVCSVCYWNENLFHVATQGDVLRTQIVFNASKKLEIKTSTIKVKDATKLETVTENGKVLLVYLTKNNILKCLPDEDDEEKTIFSNLSAKMLIDTMQTHTDRTRAMKLELDFVKKLLHNMSLSSWLAANKISTITESCSLKMVKKEDGSFNLIISLAYLGPLTTTDTCHLHCYLTEVNPSTDSYSISKTVKISNPQMILVLNINTETMSRFSIKLPLYLNCYIVISRLPTEYEKYRRFINSLFPMSFFIKTFTINELTLLSNQSSDESFCVKSDVEMPIIKIAKLKLRNCPASDEMKSKISHLSQNKVKNCSNRSLSFSVFNETLRKRFPKPSEATEFSLSIEFAKYLTKNSLLVYSPSQTSFYFRNVPIDIKAIDQPSISQISLKSSSICLLSSIRQAIIQDLHPQYKIQTSNEVEEEITLDSAPTETTRSLLKKLNEIPRSDYEQVTEIYFEIRDKLSRCLPIF